MIDYIVHHAMTDMDVHQAAAELQAAATDAGDTRAVRAIDKAMLHYANGVRPSPTVGGWLIASATTLNQVYRISAVGGCNCAASEHGAPICWHSALIEVIEAAQARAVPPTTFRRQAKAELDADQRARQAQAQNAMDELYA